VAKLAFVDNEIGAILACQSNLRFIGFGAGHPPVFRFSHDPAGASDGFIHAFLLSFLLGKQPTRHLPKLLASVAEIGNLNGLNGVWRSSLGVLQRTLLLFFARAERLFGPRESRSFAYRFFMYAKIGD